MKPLSAQETADLLATFHNELAAIDALVTTMVENGVDGPGGVELRIRTVAALEGRRAELLGQIDDVESGRFRLWRMA